MRKHLEKRSTSKDPIKKQRKEELRSKMTVKNAVLFYKAIIKAILTYEIVGEHHLNQNHCTRLPFSGLTKRKNSLSNSVEIHSYFSKLLPQ